VFDDNDAIFTTILGVFNENPLTGIAIMLDDDLTEFQMIPLGGNNGFASEVIYNDGTNTFFTEDNNGSGEIIITNLDIENRLISGTFEFIAISDAGETVTITDGSFTNVIF